LLLISKVRVLTYAHHYVVNMVYAKLPVHVNVLMDMLILIVPMQDALVAAVCTVSVTRLRGNVAAILVLLVQNVIKNHARINVVNMVVVMKNQVIVFVTMIGKDLIVPRQNA